MCPPQFLLVLAILPRSFLEHVLVLVLEVAVLQVLPLVPLVAQGALLETVHSLVEEGADSDRLVVLDLVVHDIAVL